MPTWNPLGVGANHVYYLRLAPSHGDRKHYLVIRHPCAHSDGWMKAPANLPYAAGFGPLLNQDTVILAETSPYNHSDPSMSIDDKREMTIQSSAVLEVESRSESVVSKLDPVDGKLATSDQSHLRQDRERSIQRAIHSRFASWVRQQGKSTFTHW